MTVEGLDAFFVDFAAQWDAVQRIEIAGLKKLKVSAGWFGGSIAAKKEGSLIYSPLITAYANKADAKRVKAFYADLTK